MADNKKPKFRVDGQAFNPEWVKGFPTRQQFIERARSIWKDMSEERAGQVYDLATGTAPAAAADEKPATGKKK